MEIRSGAGPFPWPGPKCRVGPGDVLLQILLRQVVPGVVTQGPAQEPRNGKAREHWLAVQEDWLDEPPADPLVQGLHGSGKDLRCLASGIEPENVQGRGNNNKGW